MSKRGEYMIVKAIFFSDTLYNHQNDPNYIFYISFLNINCISYTFYHGSFLILKNILTSSMYACYYDTSLRLQHFPFGRVAHRNDLVRYIMLYCIAQSRLKPFWIYLFLCLLTQKSFGDIPRIFAVIFKLYHRVYLLFGYQTTYI